MVKLTYVSGSVDKIASFKMKVYKNETTFDFSIVGGKKLLRIIDLSENTQGEIDYPVNLLIS